MDYFLFLYLNKILKVGHLMPPSWDSRGSAITFFFREVSDIFVRHNTVNALEVQQIVPKNIVLVLFFFDIY